MTGLMGHFPQSAGTASALAGTLRFGIGAVVGILVNLNPRIAAADGHRHRRLRVRLDPELLAADRQK